MNRRRLIFPDYMWQNPARYRSITLKAFNMKAQRSVSAGGTLGPPPCNRHGFHRPLLKTANWLSLLFAVAGCAAWGAAVDAQDAGRKAVAEPARKASAPKEDAEKVAVEKIVEVGEKPAEEEKKLDQRAMLRKLQTRTDVKASKTPLIEVIAQLSKQHGVPIRLDIPALKKSGVTANALVTVSIKNFTLNAALNRILKDLGLHHVVRDGEIVVTAGVEPGEEAEVAAEPLPPQARPVRALARPAILVDAAAVDAGVDVMEKQFKRQFRSALRIEFNFVERVCEPTPEQMEVLKQALEKYRAEEVKKYSEQQKKLARSGRQPQQIPQRQLANNIVGDPQKMIRQMLERTIKANLSAEQAARYQAEIDRRVADRKRAAIRGLIATLDQDLSLSSKQREDLSEAFGSNWQGTWAQQLDAVMQQGGQFLPSLPPKLIEPILNATQKKIWRGSQANQQNKVMRIQMNMGGALWGMMGGAVVDDIDGDDGEDDDAEDGKLNEGRRDEAAKEGAADQARQADEAKANAAKQGQNE